MIISCPNCSTRYRLAAAGLSGNTRMRCAACGHRWQIEAEDELSSPDAEPAPEPPAAHPAEPDNSPDPPEAGPGFTPDWTDHAPPTPEPSPPASTLWRNLAAIAFGTALAIAAGALWITRIDPAELPVIGDRIEALAPQPLPAKITFTARTTTLPSGDPLLEINGKITNIGTISFALSGLEARLAGPQGTVRRWRIALPGTDLQPGQSMRFTTTATAFPKDARLVGIRPAR